MAAGCRTSIAQPRSSRSPHQDGSAVHASIEARVDVFHEARGASRLLEWVRSEARRSGFRGQKLARFRIGAAGLILWVGDSLTLVTWRQGRVFAAVFGDELPRARLVALARVQQRRIVAELR